MSARGDVLQTMYYAAEWSGGTYEDHVAECVADLDAYRDQVLREHAQAIRMLAFQKTMMTTVIGPFSAADLIDPEVKPS